jgi:hypothetical protein
MMKKIKTHQIIAAASLVLAAIVFVLWGGSNDKAPPSHDLPTKQAVLQAEQPASDAMQAKLCADQASISPFGSGMDGSNAARHARCKAQPEQAPTKQALAGESSDKSFDKKVIADLQPMWKKFKQGQHDLAGPILMVQLKCENFSKNYDEEFPGSKCGLGKNQLAEARKYLQKEAATGSAQANVELALWTIAIEDNTIEQLVGMVDALTKGSDRSGDFILPFLQNQIDLKKLALDKNYRPF